jgi:hypothetical protein
MVDQTRRGKLFHVAAPSPGQRFQRIQLETPAMRLSLQLLAVWSAFVSLFQLCFAHLIEVPAGKKECFFEDLHQNDKVRPNAFGIVNMC